jgi:hypothetical protein
MIEPNSTAGRRKVPIAAILLDYLIDHRLAGRDGLAFGRQCAHRTVTRSGHRRSVLGTSTRKRWLSV